MNSPIAQREPDAVVTTRRCEAAHKDDPRPCVEQIDAVRLVDQEANERSGCVLHAATLLASVQSARVYPLNGPEGVAIEVHRRAQALLPFDFLPPEDAGRALGRYFKWIESQKEDGEP